MPTDTNKHSSLYSVLINREALDAYMKEFIRAPAGDWKSLNTAFRWSRTRQGFSFWLEISHAAQRLHGKGKRQAGSASEALEAVIFNDYDIQVIEEKYAEYFV